MNTAPQRQVYEKPTDWTLMSPIFSSHIKRIGWIRTFAGGLPMYTCIPALVVLHLTTCVLGYQWLLRPLFKLPKVYWSDYVIIDRHRIEGMNWFDHFNCMFCGYANGLTTMANVEIDNLAKVNLEELSLTRKLLALLLVIPFVPLIIFFEVSIQIIYNILVSRPLGMHRTSIDEAHQVLMQDKYAEQFPPASRFPVLAVKSMVFRFAMALEQIESSFCPLKHLETREGVVYPSHHSKFFGPNQLEEMREVLSTKGTVSDRLPKY
ncbi:MAG: hypothetical protein WAO12_02420 [Venatoribacter sp.]